MNCVNHPETPVASYCQNCGKPLCSACVRQVGSITYCEPCLAAKLGVPPAGTSAGSSYVNVGGPGGFQYSAAGPLPPGMLETGPNPALATLLGFIPGVGAMYNGQFIKALVHVLVFVILILMTANENGIFGVFIAAWVFYQVFDAHHTAQARRDGLPLPDPFGLNELGVRLGIQSPRQAQAYSGTVYPPPPPGGPFPPGVPPNPASASGAATGAPGDPAYFTVPPVPGAATYTPEGYPVHDPAAPLPPVGRPEPVGAIILIALGIMFLLGTMGWFQFNWIGHGWPLILIAVGVWIFFKRSRELPPPGGGL
ncbi:MAG TPA: B-box zinc finger protein [Acidisarcina sp.]